MGKRRSIVRQVLDRFDRLMATGESRHAAKLAARAAGNRAWSVSDGRIHSFRTRKGYQAVALRLVNWCAATQGWRPRSLDELDARAEELVARYLREGLAGGKSAWTLKTECSALRLFFGRRDLAASVTLPPRRRTDIRRSRLPARRDATLDPTHWQDLVTFLNATGLRRSEVAHIRARDVFEDGAGRLQVTVKGKGGRWRIVPVLDVYIVQVRRLLAERAPDERLFLRVPSHLDIHATRRRYAQKAYQQASGAEELPPPDGRLRRGSVDSSAVAHVSRALGHSRGDVTTTHYLR
jgi:integrase